MEKIAFIVERLNAPPFNKNINTMTELDSKSSLELLDILCLIIVKIDPDQESITKENTEGRVARMYNFLNIMKFNIPEDQVEDFQNLLMSGDKDILHTVMHWTLQRFDHLQKRAYLAKFLMPVEVPPEFRGDDLIEELCQTLKVLQTDFKSIHKQADQIRSTSTRPSELKAEIIQLEQETSQLNKKIQKMKRDANEDEAAFKDMLKATSALRREQETDVMSHEQLRDHRKMVSDADMRYNDASRRLEEMRTSGAMKANAEQILKKLQDDVKEIGTKKEALDKVISERETHLEKLQGWEKNDRVTTDDDVRYKREQVEDLKEEISTLQDKLEAALERNQKLFAFRQASTIADKKFREREDEVEKLQAEQRRMEKQIEEKESTLRDKERSSGKIGKNELKKYGAVVREKIEKYKRMREILATLRSELVVLQRTDQLLQSRHESLGQFLSELEKKQGVEGFRDNQKKMVEMAERTAEVDSVKGSTLEDISSMVEQISREFKSQQAQLKPLIMEVKAVRGDYAAVDAIYNETKGVYDKVAVGLEMDKQALEKEANNAQDDCLREESRYHYLQNLIGISKIKLERLEQERKWQAGDGRMMRDFASFKELYAHKLTQQESLTKQLRKKQKELKENSGALTNQKTNFLSLQRLLKEKMRVPTEGFAIDGEVFTPAYAEVVGAGHGYSGGGADSKGDRYYSGGSGGGGSDDGNYSNSFK